MSARNVKYQEWLAFSLLLLLVVVLFRGVDLRASGDDAVARTILDQYTLLGFLQERYQTWSGRTLLEAIAVVTVRHDVAYKLAIPAAYVLLCHQVYCLTLRHVLRPLSGLLGVACVMLLFPAGVSQWGGWWVTGFYNYLLPLALGLFGFRCVVEGRHAAWRYRLPALLAVAIACQQEQVALCLLLALTLLIGYRLVQRQRVGRDFMMLVTGSVSAAFLFAAPGNLARLQVAQNNIPEFPDIGLLGKLMLGVDRVNAHANDPANLVFLAAIGVTFVAVSRLSRPWAGRYPALFVLGVGGLTLLLGGAGMPVTDKLAFAERGTPADWQHVDIFMAYAKTMMVYAALAVGAMSVARAPYEWLVGPGLLLLSFMMIVAVGFSPTVYSSGMRIYYVSDVLVGGYVCWMFAMLVTPGRQYAPLAR